jgi:hypothetical protein
MKNKIELLVGYHRVTPIYPIDKYKTRFAYRIKQGKKFLKGLWELDYVDINKQAYGYKRVKEVV